MAARSHTLAALLAAALATAPAAAAAAGRRVVVLPFETVPGVSAGAGPRLAAAVAAALAAAGDTPVAGAEVAAFLRERRIRYLDSLTPEEHGRLVRTFGADAVLAGTVLEFDARKPARDPVIAARVALLAPDGGVVWTHLLDVSGAGQARAFGVGRVEAMDALVGVAADRLARAVPPTLAPVRVDRAASRWMTAHAYRSRSFLQQDRRIAILPFENSSRDPVAPRVLDAVLRHRLGERHRLQVVSPGALRAALVANAMQPPANMPRAQLRALAEALGIRHFLTGQILEYGAGTDGATVEVSVSLFDVTTGAVVWSALHRRSARAYEALFGGAEPDLVGVADRVAAELADAFTR